MLSCQFEGHPGVMDDDSNIFVFYGLAFDGILEAARFLKSVSPGEEYQGVVGRGSKILWNPATDMWWSEGRWWPDKRTASRGGKNRGAYK